MLYLFTLIGSYLLTLVVLYLFGRLLIATFLKKYDIESSNIYIKIFSSILIPYLLLSSVVAILLTKGITFQWGVFIPLCLWFLYQKKHSAQMLNSVVEKQSKTAEIITLSIAATLAFSYNYFGMGSPENTTSIDTHYDLHYYAKLSESLIQTGIENPNNLFLNYLPNITLSPFMYHYLDLWFTGILGAVLPLNPIDLLLFINYPILVFLSIIGAMGVLYKAVLSNPVTLLLIVLLLFYGISSFLPFLDKPLYYQAFYRFNASLGSNPLDTKNLIVVPLFMLAIYYLRKDKLYPTLIFLVVAMSAYNTIIPAVVGGVIMFLGYDLYRKNRTPDNMAAIFLFSSFILFAFIFRALATGKSTLEHATSQLNLKSLIILIAEYLLSPWIIYGVVLIMLAGSIKKIIKSTFHINLILFLIGIQASGTLFVVLNHSMGNVNQALSNVIYPTIVVVSIFCVGLVLTNKKVVWIIIPCLLFNTINNFIHKDDFSIIPKSSLTYSYSEKFKSTLIQSLEGSSAQWVTLGRSMSPYWYYSWNNLGLFLLSEKGTNYPIDITPLVVANIKDWCGRPQNETSPFCVCNSDNKERKDRVNEFMTNYHVRYLYTQNRDLIPPYMMENLVLIAKDSVTTHEFYRFQLN